MHTRILTFIHKHKHSHSLTLTYTAIQMEEMKVKKSVKDAAKKGHMDVCKILAKELIQSRKAISKLYASKAQMNSVVMSMQHQMGQHLIVS